jgi:hypothetical protein
MRCLFGDVVGPVSIVQIPVTGINFTKNRVQGLLDASTFKLALQHKACAGQAGTNGGRICQPLR